MARNMTFDLLDHVMKVTFEQRTENNVIVSVLLMLTGALHITKPNLLQNLQS